MASVKNTQTKKMRIKNILLKPLFSKKSLLILILVFFVIFLSNHPLIQFKIWKLSRSWCIRSRTNEIRIESYTKFTETIIRPHCKCLNEHIVLKKYMDSKNLPFLRVDLVKLNKFGQQSSRNNLYRLSVDEFQNFTSTCDLYNTLKRGKHQKVLSYSIYGSKSIYFDIIEENLNRIRTFYPSFTARFYYDHTLNETMRCHFECKYPDLVDFCNVNRFIGQLNHGESSLEDFNYMHKMMWRFLPIGDSFVDVILSRDTDSFVIQREVDAVNEWLASSNIAHIMRDHWEHNFAILGGTWGFRTNLDRTLARYIFEMAIDKRISRSYNPGKMSSYGYDQEFLKYYLYPLVVDNATIHDSYFCDKYSNSKPFPTERKVLDHIGSYSYKKFENFLECPIYCRPKEHQEWRYC